jgi:hypothetical protein
MGKWEKLSKVERQVFRRGQCPDCGGGLLEGPSGGMSVNFWCSGLKPGPNGDNVRSGQSTGVSRFNDMGPFGVERITEETCQK